jgi:hypothetical protein
MPSAEAALYTILTSGSPNPVAALIGTRAYPLVLPQNPQYPAIRYQRISTARSQYRSLDGRAGYASPRFQIDAYALSHASAIEVGEAVYALLEGYTGEVGGLRIDAISTDEQAADLEGGAGPNGSNLYRMRLDVFLYYPEA